MFSHNVANEPEAKTILMFHPDRQVAAPGEVCRLRLRFVINESDGNSCLYGSLL